MDAEGNDLFLEQVDKGSWELIGGKSLQGQEVTLSYEVYCHELTVRTSYVDTEFAFIHGPSIFMGVEGILSDKVTLEVSFPPTWSKISTGLTDISPARDKFLFEAKNYDDFIDSPIQIGNHETDGFKVNNIDHELAFYGELLPHNRKVKEDIKTIVEHISDYMGGMPYDRYVFMSHFVQGLYGGLEHKNSTALQFCSRGFTKDKDYLNWLCLVSHEYFHTWNVKRIRPYGFGPFDYKNQFDTSLLWLAEGLTSFMDELFVYQCGLATVEEYLDMQVKNLNRYFQTQGRKFHSLETSGYNSWDVLYKPHENSSNSSISYYLKGGISFFLLNVLLKENGSSTKDFIQRLWSWYKATPERGMKKEEVLKIIEDCGGKKAKEEFEEYIETTIELPIISFLEKMGLSVDWDSENKIGFGFEHNSDDSGVKVTKVALDSAAHYYAINAGDEIVAINNLRVNRENISDILGNLNDSESYRFLICRLGKMIELSASPKVLPKKIKKLQVKDQKALDSFLK